MASIFISHGADPDDWFIVEPPEGQAATSIAGTPITQEMSVRSLLHAGRTVYELDARPFGHQGVALKLVVKQE